VLYGHDPNLTDIIWEGSTPPLAERAAPFGVDHVMPMNALSADLTIADQVQHVPSTRPAMTLQLQALLGVGRQEAEVGHLPLIEAVVSLRSIKEADEIAEIVTATNRSRRAHLIAMRATQPGLIERDVVRAMRSDAARLGYLEAYGPVFTVRGEVLHNPFHKNVMADGALALHDGAIMSDLGYASDITRTFPVNGRFTSTQRIVYQTVLDAQTKIIEACRPGVMYNDMHTLAMGTVFDGLRDLGITKGDTATALEAGAPALFMPHGIGHMLGLDVHDMEEIGEEYVGYDSSISRSSQFGRSNLRLARELREGFVMTVEPGCYFIPALIDQWEAEGVWNEWINFEALRPLRDFGGVRIEDVVHVVAEGAEVLGNHIPKTIDEVAAACA
jgi:Xaa-Pro aminopeptidase